MRVLFSVSSWPTHYSAMVPLGWALQAAGHELRVLCPPSQTAAVAGAGLPPVPLLGGMEVAVHNRLSYVREARAGQWPYPWTPLHPVTGAPMSTLDAFDVEAYARTDGARFAESSAAGHDAAVGFARDWRPDLVVHDPVSTEGLLAALVSGVPAVIALWGPVGTHEPAPVRILPDDLGDSFARHGLGPFGPDLIRHVLDPCPDEVAPPVRGLRLPVRYVPYNGPGVPPARMPRVDGRPRVCVTWSTALSTMTGPRSYALPMIVAALSALGVETVLTATREDAAALGPVPDSVRILERGPLYALLPDCDAVVHHGGAGSAMTAMVTGTPQLAITFASEQACLAARIATSGAGLHLPGHTATVETVQAAVAALLEDPGHRRAAAALRRSAISRPSPVELLPRLEKLAAG
ncbi:nucleotide disphospho-sugar-binding domain-containing protein [Dactylosporangium siamense]|uniref:Glycosyl transferase n=1 Tax=Dactylosporangium siamense TaxID=685454 RepID=A0A919PYM8_9ACTN|nr:nucleotide disphospho-sugar-binding domain-containing protein [Dactylosporangium siamense]GIG51666.1 glycosyl transferase [Dactylosporangium siamense]